ncbi:prepilin-type N-terminal cleavage/methylation domain-containing protein [Thalassobacillus sp. CUG 92003]|uniref:prepilin-type N-terminal cleavage/methylation domain-containing protein n=1 Tax=Thalassobacillus sp. CUG 92003 TaxID=2736641 RepID=UPI0015E67B16|nr:prepilin-type N-terminal cleavage/methylation domain-containing protein [Thalassobacillus sp. CUG 92003]
MSKIKQLVKQEKGFTLIELLAVIVILGIIAAIAVPAIGSIIGDAEEDAHDANALSLLGAARLADTSGEETNEESQYTMDFLVQEGYLDSTPSNPEGGEYSKGFVTVAEDDTFTVTLGEDIGIDGASKSELNSDE